MEGPRKYPPRRYKEGKFPLQSKSMNHNCLTSSLASVRDAIGIDVWNKIKGTKLGIIPKLVDSDYQWSAKIVQYLLFHQLLLKSVNEIWAVIGGQPIRLGLDEFIDITRLKTEPPSIESCEPEYAMFWEKLGIPRGCAGGPKWDKLAKVFGKCPGWNPEERKMVGLLCILHMGIYGLHHNSRIPLEAAKRVFKDEWIDDYPWGLVAYKSLIEGVSNAQLDGNGYTVNGCVYALLFWAFESITIFDHLYMVHQVNTNHWVAMDVNLKESAIDCYDSIMGPAIDELDRMILEQCRFVTRMVPHFLNEFIPSDVRPPSVVPFGWRRIKAGVPQNLKPGDCGVFAVKYLECLALGVRFCNICGRQVISIAWKMNPCPHPYISSLKVAMKVRIKGCNLIEGSLKIIHSITIGSFLHKAKMASTFVPYQDVLIQMICTNSTSRQRIQHSNCFPYRFMPI